MRQMKNDAVVIAAICLLEELNLKKFGRRTLSKNEEELMEAIIEVLPPSATVFCSECAELDVSRQALEGFSICREHALERFYRTLLAATEDPTRLLTPKTQQKTKEEQADFVENIRARKAMGFPPTVAEIARARLVVDGRPPSHEELCTECEKEDGVAWPACEGFSECPSHLHLMIDERVRMT